MGIDRVVEGAENLVGSVVEGGARLGSATIEGASNILGEGVEAVGRLGSAVLNSPTGTGFEKQEIIKDKTKTPNTEPDKKTNETVETEFKVDENEDIDYTELDSLDSEDILNTFAYDDIAPNTENEITNEVVEEDNENINEDNESVSGNIGNDTNVPTISEDNIDREIDSIDFDNFVNSITAPLNSADTTYYNPYTDGDESSYSSDGIETGSPLLQNFYSTRNDIETEDLELSLSDGEITENDVLSQTGERSNEEQLKTINEVANKDADGEIELDETLNPKEVAEGLNKMADNGSNITEEEVEQEQKDDNGDSEIIKKGLQLLSDDDFEKFVKESELEERYNEQKSQADFHWDKNIFGDTVYNTEDELVKALNEQGYTDPNDFDVYIGKDDQGYYFWATPSYSKERDNEAIEKSKTTPASELSKSELKALYDEKRKEENDKKEAAKLKNLPTEQIEQRIKEWTTPTPEEWERSYNNGTVGQLRSSMAEKQRYIKELSLRSFVSGKNITDEEEKILRNELSSKGNWTSLKERYPNYLTGRKVGVKGHDYEERLNLAYRDILEKRLEKENAAKKVKTEQQIENINKDIEETVFDGSTAVDINKEDVLIKDTEGNLKEINELDNNLYELTTEEIKESGIDTADINPDTDKVMGDVYGNTTVITNPNGWDEYNVEPNYGEEETYLDETKLDNKWTKWNDGTFGRKIQDNEWQLFGLEKDEYELSLIEEAKQQAEKLGLREGTYEIKVEDNEVKIVPNVETAANASKRKRLRLPKLTFGGKIEPAAKASEPIEINSTKIRPNETVNNTDQSNYTVRDNEGTVSSGSSVSTSVGSTKDISTTNGKVVDNKSAAKASEPIETNGRQLKGNSSQERPSKTVSTATRFNLPKRTLSVVPNEKSEKGSNETNRFNREQNKDTDIKTKYRRVGSSDKQLLLSNVHNDNSMITVLDRLTKIVLESYHTWKRSGEYYVFVGSNCSVRYKLGGNIETKIKGNTNWTSIRNLSKKPGGKEKLELIINDIQSNQ